MHSRKPDYYATLGLDRRCTEAQVRAAYRLLAKQLHPDVNQSSPEAVARTQALNAAYETLCDAGRREAYDRELESAKRTAAPKSTSRFLRNISQDVHLRLDEFLKGTMLEVRVNDPAAASPEIYELIIPPETAPGSRIRLSRGESVRGGFVIVRLRARPDFRFKVRGSDLRCDLRITSQRAAQGGSESVRGLTGIIRVQIPRRVGRGEIISIPNEGLPKARGGRGDLLIRVIYRPDVRITRAASR